MIRRIFFTLSIVLIYKLGVYIPIPGINLDVLKKVVNDQLQQSSQKYYIIGNIFNRISIFTLNIIPYVTASIIMQLILGITKTKNKLNKSNTIIYTKILSIILSIAQAYGVILGIEALEYKGIKLFPITNILFKVFSIINLAIGSVIITWLSEQINRKGIGNGISLIIFSNIICNIPISPLFIHEKKIVDLKFVLIVGISIITIMIVIFIEGSYKKIIIYYPNKSINTKIYDETFLPIKINMSGAMPSILSYSLLLLPASMNEFLFNNNDNILIDRKMSIFFHTFSIILFCYIYNNIIFDPKEISNNLKKSDAIIIGKKSGEKTIEYLRYLINRITFISSIYIIIICIPSEIVAFILQKPPIIGSTSILIIVNFILEVGLQITAIYLKNSCIKK